MKQEEKLICDLIYKFVEENWDKIDADKIDLATSNLPTSKIPFLKEVKKDVETALWVLTEVCNWGMDKEYLQDLYVDIDEDLDFRILKIGAKYIKMKLGRETYDYELNFTKPKTKTVIYFD